MDPACVGRNTHGHKPSTEMRTGEKGASPHLDYARPMMRDGARRLGAPPPQRPPHPPLPARRHASQSAAPQPPRRTAAHRTVSWRCPARPLRSTPRWRPCAQCTPLLPGSCPGRLAAGRALACSLHRCRTAPERRQRGRGWGNCGVHSSSTTTSSQFHPAGACEAAAKQASRHVACGNTPSGIPRCSRRCWGSTGQPEPHRALPPTCPPCARSESTAGAAQRAQRRQRTGPQASNTSLPPRSRAWQQGKGRRADVCGWTPGDAHASCTRHVRTQACLQA